MLTYNIIFMEFSLNMFISIKEVILYKIILQDSVKLSILQVTVSLSLQITVQ